MCGCVHCVCRYGYDQFGYDREGYARDGYNQDGYGELWHVIVTPPPPPNQNVIRMLMLNDLMCLHSMIGAAAPSVVAADAYSCSHTCTTSTWVFNRVLLVMSHFLLDGTCRPIRIRQDGSLPRPSGRAKLRR